MVKICILTSVHPAFDNRIFYKEAKSLLKEGYNITLIAPYFKNAIIEGIKLVYVPKKRFRYRVLGVNRNLYRLALKQKAHVYHFHDPELIPWMMRLKKKTGAKVIYDVHENVPKQILSKFWVPKVLRKFISIAFDFYERRAVKNFDFVITVGEDVKEKFKKINPNIEMIKNFPDLEKFKNIETEAEIKAKNNDIFNLVYVGGLAKIRGISQLVQAMEYLPENVKLTLLGNFSPVDYEKEIRNLKGFKKVEYLKWVLFDKVPYYLSRANIGLICLWPVENYYNSAEPTKMFEYMAAGIPVIASDFPLWKEVVEGNNCGICVDPLEPKEIAKAVEYLIEHPKEAKEMGENGRRTVLEKYNWKKESKKLLKIYEELFKK